MAGCIWPIANCTSPVHRCFFRSTSCCAAFLLAYMHPCAGMRYRTCHKATTSLFVTSTMPLPACRAKAKAMQSPVEGRDEENQAGASNPKDSHPSSNGDTIKGDSPKAEEAESMQTEFHRSGSLRVDSRNSNQSVSRKSLAENSPSRVSSLVLRLSVLSPKWHCRDSSSWLLCIVTCFTTWHLTQFIVPTQLSHVHPTT